MKYFQLAVSILIVRFDRNCVNLFVELRTNMSEEDKEKIEAAVRSARKTLARFPRTVAKQLITEESFD
ncbi:hypothetical protein V6Z11_A07G161900 [Gossypium hirsutum]